MIAPRTGCPTYPADWDATVFRVDRRELAEAPDRAGINSSAYSLDGGFPVERYVLTIEEGGWSVYYSERGRKQSELRFDTENEACDYLLMTLINDPNTRRGPARSE